jgi:hypothetical protein
MTAPQVLAPTVGALILGAVGNQNFDPLFIIAAVLAVIGALLIIPVRSVK